MKAFKKIKILKILQTLLISFIHSLFLLLLGYIWLGMTYTFGDEAFLIKWTALIKKELFAIDPKPDPGEVLFINSSASKKMVKTGADPLLLSPSVELITDRSELAGLLELMVPFKDSIGLIVIDVLFDIHADDDSLLQQRFNELGDKVLAVSFMPKVDSIVRPVLSVPYALSTYRSAAGMYFKYPVAFQDQKTVPTVIYEKLTGARIEKKGLFYRDGKKFSLKTPITDFRVRMRDFKLGDGMGQTNYSVHHLETIRLLGALMDKDDLRKLFTGKLVIIGDFNNDIHKTVFGFMPGMLILYNAYLTLREGDNNMNLGWVLLMIIGFTWISYRLMTGKGFNLFDLFKRKFRRGWVHFIVDSLDEVFFLSILTSFSYFFFNIHVNILVLFIYLKLIEFLLDILRNKYKIDL